MRGYSEYKDSHEWWISKIPSHWKVIKLKWLTPVKRGASPRPIDNPEYFDDNGEFAWVRIADVTASERYLENTTQQLSELGSSLSVKRYPGDIFLSIAGTVGKPIITNIKCCIHDGFVYFPDLDIDPEYLYYIFSTGLVYQGLGKWGTQLNLNTETVGDIHIPLPPPREIDSIVDYLDRKTSQIDDLIAKKQRLIELLQEQRAALINRAVTKGLNPDAPMKDSGIEWLGEVPAHWDVYALKRVVKKFIDYRGKTPTKTDSGVPLITAKNIKQGNIDLDLSREYISEDDYDEWMVRGLPQKHDVLMTTEAPLGEVAQIENTRIALAQRIILLRVEKNLILEDYLKYYLMSQCGQSELWSQATGSTALGIKAGKLRFIHTVVPHIEEQINIVSFLNENLSMVSESISKENQMISLLYELRTSLISEAVTGKIDVRHEVPA